MIKKGKLLILCYLIGLIPFNAFCQKIKKGNGSLADTLIAVCKNYVGKPVYNLLLDDQIRKYQSITFFEEPPSVLNGAYVGINDSVYLKLFIYNFKYLKRYNVEGKWDKSLFFKEVISYIRVYKGNDIIGDIKSP